MSQSQFQAHSNPFAAPADSQGSTVISNPSRSWYETLRIAQIAFTVLAAYVLLTPFRQTLIEPHHIAAGFIIIAGSGFILMQELRAYWSEDATFERRMIQIHSSYSISATAVSLLMLWDISGSATSYLIAILVSAASWHITAIFRNSMLRQRLQFAVAQSGNPASTSLHLSATAQNGTVTAWDADAETIDRPVKTLEERRKMLLAWLGQLLFSKRGLCIVGAAAGLMFGVVLLANCLIPVEVAGYQVNSDTDSVTGVLHTRLGGLYAKSIESWEQQAADGSWKQVDVIREVRVGSSTAVLFGEPSVQYGGGRYRFTYYVGNRIVAQYDGSARVFHVPDSK